MNNTNSLTQVAEFHNLFGHPVLATPAIPNIERCKLRVKLITEELRELQEAIDANSIVDIADALTDIQYVLSGTVLEFGLGEKFAELNNEVHRSNMSKACSSEAEAIETASAETERSGIECVGEFRNGKWFVVRGDGKTIKAISYSPANIEGVLNQLKLGL